MFLSLTAGSRDCVTLLFFYCAVAVFREGLFRERDADPALHRAVGHRMAENHGSTHRVGSLTEIQV